MIPKWLLCSYSSKRRQSVLWYNLDKELNRIKDFLNKRQFLLYWIRHRYQSKTCVEHIEQVIDKSLINSTNSSLNLLYFLHMRVICLKDCKCIGYLIRFSLNLSLKLFFNKAHFYKVLWVSFSGKDYYVLLLVLLVLNKFIEINTLIKRNLNFKCEVKSHKVRLQAYCNKPLLKWSYLYLSITWLHSYDVTSTRREVATRLLSKRCTCSRHLVTVAPPKVNIWVFVKIRALRVNDVINTLGGVTPNILSNRCICSPRLVIIIPLEVKYAIMVL